MGPRIPGTGALSRKTISSEKLGWPCDGIPTRPALTGFFLLAEKERRAETKKPPRLVRGFSKNRIEFSYGRQTGRGCNRPFKDRLLGILDLGTSRVRMFCLTEQRCCESPPAPSIVVVDFAPLSVNLPRFRHNCLLSSIARSGVP